MECSGLKNPYPVVASDIGVVNDLTISYDGNQMKKVEDAVSSYQFYQSPYFYDNANQEQEYLYDANGSMTADLNKQISKIAYNSLNLPESLQFLSGNMINYSYDAIGVKRKVESLTSREQLNIPMGTLSPLADSQISHKEVTNYSSNIVYDEYGIMTRLLLPDGYIQYERGNSSGGYVYYSQVKDHLGSVRADVSMFGVVKGYTSYYASGMEMVRNDLGLNSPYRYNGKEFQEMHGLNQYDYIARSFDPGIPRFTTVDPMAEKYYSVSPYAYCLNNPLIYTDPRGDTVRVYTETVGSGHSWLSTGEGDDLTIYSFATHNKEGMEGDGILAIYKGDAAQAYLDIKNETTGDVESSAVTDVSDSDMDQTIETLVQNATVEALQSNNNGSSTILKTKDNYNFVSNNCTHFVTESLNKSGSKVFHRTVSQQTSTVGTVTTVPIVLSPITPVALRKAVRKNN